MEDVLKMLYAGRIHPQERNEPSSPEWKAAMKQYEIMEKKVLDETEEATRDSISALMEERNTIAAMEAEHAYISGMRMGARLILALLQDKKDLPPLT